MSKRNPFRNSLSKNLMQMKFMQKTKAMIEKDLEEQQTQSLLDQQYSESMRKEGQKYIVDNSYLLCERLSFGRMSFKGMNPEIEKLMRELDTTADKTDDKTNKKDDSAEVSDEEMTNRYSKYIQSDDNRNHRKRSKFSKQNNRQTDKRLKKF